MHLQINISNRCPRYVKIHVPMEVLKQYGEILRMRLKLKVGPLLFSMIFTFYNEKECQVILIVKTLHCYINTRHRRHTPWRWTTQMRLRRLRLKVYITHQIDNVLQIMSVKQLIL